MTAAVLLAIRRGRTLGVRGLTTMSLGVGAWLVLVGLLELRADRAAVG